MKENEDFYLDENGNTVFTTIFLLKRNCCCKNKCRHCPWGFGSDKNDKQKISSEDKLL